MDKAYHHYAHGKLLLTGEYFVLDGAEALAVPTLPGQHFKAYSVPYKQSLVHWKSLERDGNSWFEGKFYLEEKFYPSYVSDESTGRRILEFLNAALELAPDRMIGFANEVETRLEFDRSWGLGSSSTLVASFAKWLDIDAYELLRRTFGGSGYDVACAEADRPILFSNQPEPPLVQPTDLDWNFKDKLLFVYLGYKQDSRSGIRRYEENPAKREILEKMTRLTRQMARAGDLHEFKTLMNEHEDITSSAIGLPAVKTLHFSDFEGSVKSLGAWGGDFVLAASEGNREDVRSYFASKGLDTAFSWNDLILDQNRKNE